MGTAIIRALPLGACFTLPTSLARALEVCAHGSMATVTFRAIVTGKSRATNAFALDAVALGRAHVGAQVDRAILACKAGVACTLAINALPVVGTVIDAALARAVNTAPRLHTFACEVTTAFTMPAAVIGTALGFTVLTRIAHSAFASTICFARSMVVALLGASFLLAAIASPQVVALADTRFVALAVAGAVERTARQHELVSARFSLKTRVANASPFDALAIVAAFIAAFVVKLAELAVILVTATAFAVNASTNVGAVEWALQRSAVVAHMSVSALAARALDALAVARAHFGALGIRAGFAAKASCALARF